MHYVVIVLLCVIWVTHKCLLDLIQLYDLETSVPNFYMLQFILSQSLSFRCNNVGSIHGT